MRRKGRRQAGGNKRLMRVRGGATFVAGEGSIMAQLSGDFQCWLPRPLMSAAARLLCA
jgi:hypothetical protein